MRRFLAGFACGAVLTGVVALALRPAPGTPAVAPSTSDATIHETTAAPPSASRRVAGSPESERPRVHVPEPAATAPSSQPQRKDRDAAPADDDTLAPLRAAIATRDGDQAWQAAAAVRKEHGDVVVPRDLVVELARWLPTAENSRGVDGALFEALGTWDAAALEGLLREVQAAAPGSNPLERGAPAAAWHLGTAHELNDVAEALASSPDADRRRAAACLAATSYRADPALVVRILDASSEPDVRAEILRRLREMADAGRGGAAARELAGRCAVRAFRGHVTRVERESAMPLLVHGGTEGLDIAQELVEKGGLSGGDRTDLIDGLVAGGRAVALIDDTRLPVAVRTEVAAALFDMDPPRPADVLAVWPRLPDLLAAQDDDTWISPAYTAAEMGRLDLVESLARDERLRPVDRAEALDVLLREDGAEHAHSIDVAAELARAASTDVELRKDIVDSIYNCWDVDERRQIPRFLALAEEMAAKDANEWVRNDAADLAEFLRGRLQQR